MPGLNSIYNEYGKNKNTLLIFETNFFDSKSSFQSWCNSKGVQYDAISKNEGGSSFNKNLKNNNAGNPKYLIHPDSTFERVGSVQGALDAANVSKDPIDDDDDEKPVVAITSELEGKTFVAGSSISLNWTATDNDEVSSIKIEYMDGNWNEIATLSGNKTSLNWTAPNKNILNCKIKVTAIDASDNSAYDESGTFDIAVDIDTINPSPNIFSFCNSYPNCDTFGSTIDTGSGFKTATGVQTEFQIVASDSTKDKWSWGSIITRLPEKSTLEGVTHIKICYSANKEFRLTLQQPPLDTSGESFFTTLESGSNNIVTLKIDNTLFKKPDWSKSTEELDLSKVTTIAFEADAIYAGGDYAIDISEVILYNYNGSTPTAKLASKAIAIEQLYSVKNGQLSLVLPSAQKGTITLFTANGKRVLYLGDQYFNTGSHTIDLPTSLAQGVYLAKYTSSSVQLITKVIVKQ